jgi:hypothetical protein
MSAFQSSEALRKLGNEEYKKAFGETPATNFADLRIGYAEEAKRLFLQASRVASAKSGAEDWLSAMKNLGVVCLKLASFKGYQERKTRDIVMFQFQESIMYLSEALYHSRSVRKSPKWMDDVAEKIRECCNCALQYVLEDGNSTGSNYGKRCSALTSMISHPEKQMLASALVQSLVADEIIKAAIIADERGEWQRSFSLSCEAEMPIAECSAALRAVPMEYGLYPELTESLRDLEHSRLTYLARSESAKLRAVAVNMQTQLLFVSETLDMDLLWVCVDHYRAAMLAASRSYEGIVSHESEAIAAANLGSLFDKVLKMHKPARVLYLHAIHLADVVTHQCGSTYFHCEWYQSAKTGIEEDNRRNDAFDSAKVAAQRDPILLKLKPELTAMEAAVSSFEGRNYSAYALLVHLYAKHPPKCENFSFEANSLDRDVSEDVKKAVLKATTYYHPDRKSNKTAGIEWLILCEEITKTLNNVYCRWKGD